jgi:AraC-like DNA-binding protein
MKIFRQPQIISGFIYEDPLEDLPAVTHCGEALCVPRYTLETHSHRGFEFAYLARGEATWRVGKDRTLHRMGDLFITYPHERHSGEGRAVESHHLWIGLELEKLGTEGRDLADYLRRKKVRLLPGCHAAEPILRAIVGQVVSGLPRKGRVTLAYLRVLFALIEQQSGRQAAGKRRNKTVPLPYSYSIQKAIAYMEKNLDRRLPLSELAAVASLKQMSHFCTQFRREVGITPATHHLQLRLNAARNALRQPALDITRVAMQFGFSSSQHFSTAFQDAFGLSPRAWRKG